MSLQSVSLIQAVQGCTAILLKAFARITERWSLGRSEQRLLLATSRSTLNRWLRNPESAKFSHDQLERVSCVLGIFAGLHRILGETPLADDWINRGNADFDGPPPLARMLGGNVRVYGIQRNPVSGSVKVLECRASLSPAFTRLPE
jgi:hypothetical protein